MKLPGSINNLNYNNVPINWPKVNEVIKSANRIMLTTHENPDGDGLGSECGIFYHLKEIGKDVRIINYSEIPAEYDYLNKENIFLAGIDFIDQKLNGDINVTSPTGLKTFYDLSKINLAKTFWKELKA